jgi:hypothetical protein
LQDNCRFYGENLTDGQVQTLYNADIAAGNVVITTNVVASTAGVAAAVSYVAAGDVNTNYVVGAANSLNAPAVWSTVQSLTGAGGATKTYYEVVGGNTNRFFQVHASYVQ